MNLKIEENWNTLIALVEEKLSSYDPKFLTLLDRLKDDREHYRTKQVIV